MDKLQKNEQSQWEEKMEVDNEEEEYDPEYPEIRSSAEMTKYKVRQVLYSCGEAVQKNNLL